MRKVAAMILTCVCFFSYAQNNTYHFTTYTVSQGLSNNSINCITKDSRNFIWIGTAEGLNRFDGSRFISFFSDRDDPASLSGNIISDILQYRPGQLLISTNNGLSVLDTYKNRFENNKITRPEIRKGSGNYIRSLFKDKQGRVYVNYSGVIDVFNDTLGFMYRLTDLPWARSLQGVLINKEPWMQDSENRIWLPTDNNGLCIIDERNKKVYSETNNPLKYPFMKSQTPIRSFLFDEQKQVVWYSVWGKGLERYDLKTKKLQQQLFSIPVVNEARCINSITREKSGRLICGGGQAIYSVDAETLEYKIINENNAIHYLPAFLGSSILNDSANIWIGTETKGLMKLPARESYIQQIQLPYPIHDYTNTCSGIIHAENGLIYMAYWQDGLIEIDPVSHELHNYTFRDKQGDPILIIRICEDKKGRLWVGNTNGFFLFDKKTKKLLRPDWLPPSASKLNISYMHCDKQGNVWVSFRLPNSLGVYKAAENKFYYYENYRVNNQPVADTLSIISRITEDEKGNIWMISYLNGEILCHENASGQWKSYTLSKKETHSNYNYGLRSICPTGANTIWLSNDVGLGLAKYNYLSDAVSYITRKNGLLSDNIVSITKGIKDNLYLVSNAGINLYNPVSNKIRSLTLNDENINLSFASHQFYDSSRHQLLYGLNDRILFINDGVWEEEANKQETWIDKITVNNNIIQINPATQHLSLNYFEKNIAINFASVNYTENSSLSYAYKMEGADKDWISAPQLPLANYTNLSPGRYTFMVKAKNQTGEWGPVNSSLLILIAPPFWQTWWFITLAIALATLSVYWVFRRRIKTIRHEAEMKQTIAETEMMALKAQMNPHFIFNCINSIDALIQSNDKYSATVYLNKFAKLIRNILDSSKQNTVTLTKDIDTLKLYIELEQLRHENKFSATISADEALLQDDHKVPPLIIQPFVENAILHGIRYRTDNNGILSIRISKKEGCLQYIIEDNGVGRDAFKSQLQKEKISYGIDMSNDRVKLFNNEKIASVQITDLFENNKPSGTKVEVLLKIH
jgi:ligand-binding sensor domain-containing protein/anti-sigma regulatory factor (Ser/Thr protein kinase)